MPSPHARVIIQTDSAVIITYDKEEKSHSTGLKNITIHNINRPEIAAAFFGAITIPLQEIKSIVFLVCYSSYQTQVFRKLCSALCEERGIDFIFMAYEFFNPCSAIFLVQPVVKANEKIIVLSYFNKFISYFTILYDGTHFSITDKAKYFQLRSQGFW